MQKPCDCSINKSTAQASQLAIRTKLATKYPQAGEQFRKRLWNLGRAEALREDSITGTYMAIVLRHYQARGGCGTYQPQAL